MQAIYLLEEISHKYRERERELHMIFVDFRRKRTIRCLETSYGGFCRERVRQKGILTS